MSRVQDFKFLAHLLVLETTAFCSLRFIHREDTLLVFLIVEVPNIKEFKTKDLKMEALMKLKKCFSDSLHFLIFDETDSFLKFNLESGDMRSYNSQELQKYFGEIDNALISNVGTYKEINKTTNDSFQKWTRGYLTKNCVVNDIDAILLNKSNVIYELKRVKESLETWKPYLDDFSNYNSFFFIAHKFKFSKRIIAYNEANSKEVAYHFNVELVADKSSIRGCFFILPPETTVKDFIGKNYVSNNARQTRY